MDRSKKIIVAMFAIMFLMVAVFMFSIISYNPPKKELPSVANNSLFENKNTQNPEQKYKNAQNPAPASNNTKSQGDFGGRLNPSETHIAGQDAEILVRLENINGEFVPGLSCELFEILPNMQRQKLYIKNGDIKGECLFFKLVSGKKYEVEISSENSPVSIMSTNNPAVAGIRYTRLIIVPDSIAERYIIRKNSDPNVVGIGQDF